MTRIAVFCDGTWNSSDSERPTSVRKFQSILLDGEGTGQKSRYFAGIGTASEFDGPVQRFLTKWGGGAFGWGLDSKVKEAYRFIAEFYRPGDEIYLFGFSRGAYTARSVAGMIRKCGIVTDTTIEGINAAFRLYRSRGLRNHPDAERVLRQRKALSPRFATSQEDLEWRADGSHMVNIAYLGVWDTVGARGLPLALLGPVAAVWNMRYRFHDMKLSSSVRSARHAVAVDERRLFYRPALWDNLDKLNGGASRDPLRPYQQLWFVGTHGVVGGSGETQALSSLPLIWVVEGAGRLRRDPDAIFPPMPSDPLAEAPEITPQEGLLSAWRKGPSDPRDIHPSALARARARADYRPGSIRRYL